MERDKSRPRCEKCMDTGRTPKGEVCGCRLLSYFKRLGYYKDVGKPTDTIKQAVRALATAKLNRRFLFETQRSKMEGILVKNWFDRFIAYYLFSTRAVLSFKRFNMQFLTDLYMGKVNIGLPEDQKEDSFYQYSHGTFIVEYTGSTNKALDVLVLNAFVDHYEDRNIFVYFGADAAEKFHGFTQRTDFKALLKMKEG